MNEKVKLRPIKSTIIESALVKAKDKLETMNRIVIKPATALYELTMSALTAIFEHASEVAHHNKEVVSVNLDDLIIFIIENRVSEDGDKAGNIAPSIMFGPGFKTFRTRRDEPAIDKPHMRKCGDKIIKEAMKIARETLAKENNIVVPENDMLYEIMLSTLESIIITADDVVTTTETRTVVEFDDKMTFIFDINKIEDGFEVESSIELGWVKLDVKDDTVTEEME